MKAEPKDRQTWPVVPERIQSRLLLGSVLLVGLVLTILASMLSERTERTQIAGNFQKLADYQMVANRERLHLIEELVAGLRRAVTFQDELTRVEFDGICADISTTQKGFLSLQWVEVVAAADRANVESKLRADYGYPITIKSRTADGTFTPAETDEYYWAIRYAYPFEPNAFVLGYNVRTAPTAADLQRAATTGKLAVSAPFRLAQSQDPNEELGIIFILPVTTASPTGPVLKGFIQGVFPTSGIFGPALIPAFQGSAVYRYLDKTDASQPPIAIYATNEYRTDDNMAPIELRQQLDIGGREWLFNAQPGSEWIRQHRTIQSELILFGGLVITALLFLLVRSFVKRTRWVEALVEERTQQLFTQQSELRAIIDNSPNGIWIKDLEGRYLLVNQEMCDIYQRSPEDIIGQTDTVFYPAEVSAELQEADRRALQSESHILTEGEFTILGEQRHYYTVKFPVRKIDGTPFGIGGIATDVTHFKRVETQLAETQKLESLGVLAGGIAHDFNNLLTGILGNASLIAYDLPPDTDNGRGVREIESAAIRAAELCRQMLAYSGRGSFVVEQIDLTKTVAGIVPLLRSSVGSRLDLRLELANDVPFVDADPSQIQQIIMNLVINAGEALVNGNGWVEVSTAGKRVDSLLLSKGVGHPDLPGGLYASFKVRDNGSGIEPAKLKRIFEPFFTTKFTGRGLGLSAVLGIVRGHKGSLLVESQLGKGTTFELLLPSSRLCAPESASPPDLQVEAPSLHDTRAVVVDDESSVRELICRVLKNAGAHCDVFATGDDAVREFRAGLYDLAIIDLTLPGTSGREVLNQMRSIDPHLATLMISGYAEQEARGDWGGPSPDGFLQKPFSHDGLLSAVHALHPQARR